MNKSDTAFVLCWLQFPQKVSLQQMGPYLAEPFRFV